MGSCMQKAATIKDEVLQLAADIKAIKAAVAELQAQQNQKTPDEQQQPSPEAKDAAA